MFDELLAMALHASRRYHATFALLFIDLDGFKAVNDTLGHAAGDQLLQRIALRFRQALRATDVVARLGGDEFVVLMRDADTHEHVAHVARKLLEAARHPVPVAGRECAVSASIGIAMHPADGDDEATLLRHADAAMYLAKQLGRNAFRFHSHCAVSDPY
jgi:diguanylate cyclase (GGDEF)-like protein